MASPSASSPDPRRLYSWWWDSHIVPKNSKWLQENLTDIERKIMAMIKIIDLDGDTFTWKAEMYYRKRPELRTLLEEFYRTYRSLAERYDRQAGELRHAHRAMVQVLPDQISFELDDDDLPPETAAATETDTQCPELLFPFLDKDDDEMSVEKLQREVSSLSEENEELKKQLDRCRQAELEAVELKEDALEQCRQSGARLSSLRAEVIRTQEEFNKFKETMNADADADADDKAYKSLHLELQNVRRRAVAQQAEMEKLAADLQEKRRESTEVESERRALEQQLGQARETLEMSEMEKKELREQSAQSAAKVIRLQDEIISLKDALRQLESEVALHAEEEKTLRSQLATAQADRDESLRRHSLLAEQIQAVNSGVESLGSLAQQVKDGNVELKEIISSHESVSALHAESLRQLTEMSLRNAELGMSLSAVTNEAAMLNKQKAALEKSCEQLNAEMLVREANQRELLLQLETMATMVDELSGKNFFLDSSLSDAIAELDFLRRVLGDHGELLRKLERENSELRSEKEELAASLMSALDQVAEVRCRNDNDREEVLSITADEHRMIEAQIETLVLQQTVLDMNSELSAQADHHNEAAARAAGLNLELQWKSAELEDELHCLLERNEKLIHGVRSVASALGLDLEHELDDDVVFKLVVHEIRPMMDAMADAQDAKQNQLIEQSLAVTMLEHFGHEVSALRVERSSLKQELLAKKSEVQDLEAAKEELMKKTDASTCEALVLRSELDYMKAIAGKIEEECCNAADECVNSDILGVIFRSVIDERTQELQSLQRAFDAIAACESLTATSTAAEEEEVISRPSAEVSSGRFKVDLSPVKDFTIMARELDDGGSVSLSPDVKMQTLQAAMQALRRVVSDASVLVDGHVGGTAGSLKDSRGMDDSACPSAEIVVEKEMCVDRQEIPASSGDTTASHCQEWKQQVIGRLYADAEKLVALQIAVRDLKTSTGASAAAGAAPAASFQLVGLKAQLHGAETAISQLVDRNNELWKETEGVGGGRDGERWEVLESAAKASEEIAAVEEEVRGLQQLLLPTEPQRQARAALSEYIYGKKRRGGKQKRSGGGCGCISGGNADELDD